PPLHLRAARPRPFPCLCQRRPLTPGDPFEPLVDFVGAGVRVLARRQHDAVAEAGELNHLPPPPACGRSGTTTASSGGWTMRSTSAANLASAVAFSGAKSCTL